MSKKNKSKIKGIGENCPKCFQPMQRREHHEENQAILRRSYYYSEWDYCWKCRHVQLYEEFKIKSPKGKDLDKYFEEKEETKNLFDIAMMKD